MTAPPLRNDGVTHDDAPVARVGRPRWKRFVVSTRRAAVAAVFTYAGVCLTVGMFQAKLIYFPDRGYSATPAEVGLAYEDLRLGTSDGVRIAAWYVPSDRPKGTILVAHGNAGNLSNCLATIETFQHLGYNVLAFDYRGFGASEGKPTEEGTYRDAEAAWKYLVETRGESPKRIVLFGRSLGGAVAIELATAHTPAAVIGESTFTNLADVGRFHYPFLPVRWLLRYRYDSLAKVSRLSSPKLLIHSRDDEIVPFEMGRKLFEAAAEPKEFLEVRGGHNDGGFEASYDFIRRVRGFIEQALPVAE